MSSYWKLTSALRLGSFPTWWNNIIILAIKSFVLKFFSPVVLFYNPCTLTLNASAAATLTYGKHKLSYCYILTVNSNHADAMTTTIKLDGIIKRAGRGEIKTKTCSVCGEKHKNVQVSCWAPWNWTVSPRQCPPLSFSGLGAGFYEWTK